MCTYVPAYESEPWIAIIEGVPTNHGEGGGGGRGLRVTGGLVHLPHHHHPLSTEMTINRYVHYHLQQQLKFGAGGH